MRFIEDKLAAMDAYFASKKESEKWLIIIGVAGIVAYLAYAYLLPYTEKKYQKSQREKTRIEKSIKENRTYLQSITVNGDRDFYLKKYTKEIETKERKIEILQDKIVLIDQNLKKLSSMLFNKKNWSEFLNSITDRAEARGVALVYITNRYVDHNGSFGHVLEITLGGKGTYKNLVKFMNDLEQNSLVTDIYGSQMKVDENSSDIMTDINVSVWGVNY